MSLVQVTNLTFSYEGNYDTIFNNVTFQFDTSWRLGFIGRNGRGKTTFLNLLLGKYPYQGCISTTVQFSYFPYHVDDQSRLSIEIVEEIYSAYQYWQLQRELNKLHLSEDILYRPYNTLSSGEQAKLMLAVLFLKDNCFLLIDEPTNHLDYQGRAQVCRYLGSKNGFILVSHDREFLDGCVDHILSINKSNIEVLRGNFSTWWINNERRNAYERAENDRLKKEIVRLEATSRQKAQWSDQIEKTKIGQGHVDKGYIGHKAAKMMSRAKAIESRQKTAIEAKSKLLKNIEYSAELKIIQTPFHTQRLVELRNVSIFYENYRACHGITFSIERGDRISLLGKNGAGKSSIIKLICGEPITYTGELKIGTGLKISYLPQDCLIFSDRLLDYIKSSGVDESLFLAILSKLDVHNVPIQKSMQSLSIGQRKKVLLALSLCQPAHLHIWDEPMNYLDVVSRMQIEELLIQYKPTIVFVEHDKAFCNKIATKFIEL